MLKLTKVDWPGGAAFHQMMEPFVATDRPDVIAPYAIGMAFTPLRGRIRLLSESKEREYASPRYMISLTGDQSLLHLASYEGGEGIRIHVASDGYACIIDRLVRNGTIEAGSPHLFADAAAWAIMAQLRTTIRDDAAPSLLTLETLSLMLQTRVIAVVGHKECSGRPGKLSNTRLRRVVDYIDSHLADDMSLATLASVAALSRFHFLRSFKRTTGMAPHQFVMARKLERARVAVEGGKHPMDAAWILGFRHMRHFASIYQRHHGFTPEDTPRLKSSFAIKAMKPVMPATEWLESARRR